ncbi:PAS domain-containing protein [Pseudomonas sp. GD03842]|uniref:PAS domain-containing protein n=1 Tax=unclassified Pseudomonas TaxID=196821 RepID=UPI000D3857D5|nr:MULTISPECIES: PAS domain-containing protein [unclassified Pseudomonas]MDH0747810.1 PAS domain-containing protein [Pseudomonas sp. GD03842]RAU40344.1 PAS domain S-box protein [Pseudomonas sp. RIT 409]RAU55499.1 PAS domain S-box protein [Pseudomonas sp. RIT 412]
MHDQPGTSPSIDLSLLGGQYSPVALIERERKVLGQLAAGLSLSEVLSDLLLAVEAQSDNMMASVLLLSEDGQYMLHGAAPSLPSRYNEAIHGIAIGEGIGSCGTAAARRQPVYVNDIATDPLWDGYAHLAVSHGLRSCWSTPIMAADGTVVGTFAVYYAEPRAPTASDIEAIALIAQTVALVIERHRSDVRLRRSQDALRDLSSELEAKVNERATERSRTWLLSPDLLSVISPDGTIEAANPAWTIALGWSPEELQINVLTLVHADDLQATRAALSQAARGRPVSRFENRYRHRDGSYRWFAWVAVLEGARIYCSARDMTLEKEQAATLAARTRERDRAWGLSQELLVIAAPDGTLLEVNARWTEQLGWLEHELVGKTFAEYTHPDDLGAATAAFEGIFHAPLEVPYEYRLRHKNGTYKWFSWTGTFEDSRVYAAGRHVTVEREQAEALRQSQKMEAVGQLTGGVAHDFNNLLTVIRSSTDLLMRPTLTEERRQRYVTAISETVDRAARLTGQLLAFARRQALQPEVFSVCDNVRAISAMMSSLTGARIQTLIDLDPTPCHVNADPSQFDTALINMAANARDAMQGEGQLSIAVRAVESLPAIREHSAVAGPFVAVSITDTGSGIPATQLERIFEPFYTTKGVGEGTGLGLSQVFGFAKQSGGEIAVASEIGKGTTFTLYLPRVAGEARAAETDSPGVSLEEGQGKQVLVVEDNGDVGDFAIQALTELGFRPTLARTAAAALELIDSDAERFDVVFSDVVMPGVTGVELAQTLRARYPSLPVVLTSGYSHILTRYGTDGFELLHKPYSIDKLSRVLLKVTANP